MKTNPRILKIALSVPEWGLNEIKYVIEYLLNHNKEDTLLKLEKEICSVLNIKYCITTSLGREALYIALKCLGIKEGDGVILPSFGCKSILDPIVMLGGIPQFADIEEDFNIDPKSIAKIINSKTKIIILPHLFGKSAEIEKIINIAKEKNLYLIDDAAQALGGKYGEKYLGTMGDFGILSFGPFKGIMATRGGALLTNDEQLYKKAKQIFIEDSSEKESINRFIKYYLKYRLRKYTFFLIEGLKKKGKDKEYQDKSPNYLLKMPLRKISKVDSSIAICQINKLTEIINRRKRIAYKLLSLLYDIQEINLPKTGNDDHVFTKFVLSLRNNNAGNHLSPAEDFVTYLRYHGIEAEPWCYIPLHLNGKFNIGNGLTKTEMIWKNVVGLPIHTKMTDSNILYMAKVVRSYFE